MVSGRPIAGRPLPIGRRLFLDAAVGVDECQVLTLDLRVAGHCCGGRAVN